MIPTGTNLEQKNTPQATIAVIFANVAIFIFQSLLLNTSDEIPLFFGFGSGSISPIGLFTSIFLHADLFHITFNMLFLWVFGPPLEDRVGKKSFLKYYILGGVAANLFSLVVNYVHNPTFKYAGIGASGAVSAVMAIYLYRCYYSKLKMFMTLYLPFNISLPAAPLLILWFLPQVYDGIRSLDKPTGTDYWAHVGGFIFGLAIGRINKYGHEGAVEYYSDKVLKEITQTGGGGWKSVECEKELLKLLNLSPQDPDLHLQLGRYYHEHDRNDEATVSYRNAIQRFFLTNSLYASYVLLEYGETFGKTISPHYHLRAAEALSINGEMEEAYRIIKPVISSPEPGQVNEKIQVLFIKLCKALSKEDEVVDSLNRFNETYAASKYKKELTESLNKKPEGIFLRNKALSVASQPIKMNGDANQEDGVLETYTFMSFHKLMDTIVDPLFLSSWLILVTIVNTIAPEGLRDLSVQVVVFCISFIPAVFYRSYMSGSARNIKVDAVTKRLELEMSATYDNAVCAEQSKDYLKASALYEKVLLYDPFKLQARFNLANIYLDHLNDQVNGKKHLQLLIKMAPKYHHFYQKALEKNNRIHKNVL